MKKKHTLQWFKNRVEKTIYRKPLDFCPCDSCQKTEIFICDTAKVGIKHVDKYFHARYIFDCQNEFGTEYFDKPV